MEGDSGIQTVEGQVGTLVMNLDGSVISASGDLEGDRKTPAILFRALQDANAIIMSADKPSGFKKLTISFTEYSYRVTIVQKKIYAVKVRA